MLGVALVAAALAGGSNNPWTWAARMYFPSEGCWRVTGRVEDVALSFVVQVVVSG
jgi:hypothetical protein